MKTRISGKDLIKLGLPNNNSINIALGIMMRLRRTENKAQLLDQVAAVMRDPSQYTNHSNWHKLANYLIEPTKTQSIKLNSKMAPFTIYGENEIDDDAKYQWYSALKLPIAIYGALMPDAHSGYGLPIGSALATDNAVIPYGVGVDIGCRMSLSLFDLPAQYANGRIDALTGILQNHTKFGMNEIHKVKHDHEVLCSSLFKEIPLLRSLHDKAYKQLGTSGGGNHFVEFGFVTLDIPIGAIPRGSYFALLSHSGSRSLGANVAKHYTRVAMKQCPLPKHIQQLAWLELSTHDGQEYWQAMQLAAEYASACHDDIHKRIAKELGCRILVNVANHHNLAWKEWHDGREVIVHRKGATPADVGKLGIVPGSMATPAYIVSGKSNESSLRSASHGAGRLYSRAQCKTMFTSHEMKKYLFDAGIRLIGGHIDESPMAYKNIHTIMALQSELVDVMGLFHPQIVRMEGKP